MNAEEYPENGDEQVTVSIELRTKQAYAFKIVHVLSKCLDKWPGSIINVQITQPLDSEEENGE